MELDVKFVSMPLEFESFTDITECSCDEIKNVKKMIKIALDDNPFKGKRGIISDNPKKIVYEMIEIQNAYDYMGDDYIKYISVEYPIVDKNTFHGDLKELFNQFVDRVLKLFENHCVVYMFSGIGRHIDILINPVDFDGNILEFTEDYVNKMKEYMDGIMSDLFPNVGVEHICIYE